jgi:hypothetical protein
MCFSAPPVLTEETVEINLKRIAELEKDKDYFSDALDKQIEATLKLQKENTELKADNSEWEKASDKWKSVYELTNNQLTKAKHYIKELARAVEHSYSVLSWQRPPIKAEAEQFLNSEVEK